MAIKNTPTFVIKDPTSRLPELPNISPEIKKKAAEKVAKEKEKPVVEFEKPKAAPKMIPSQQEMADNRMNTARQRAEYLGELSNSEVDTLMKAKNKGYDNDYITKLVATSRRIGDLSDEEIQGLKEARDKGVDRLEILDTIEKARKFDEQSAFSQKSSLQQATSMPASFLRGIADVGAKIGEIGMSEEDIAKSRAFDEQMNEQITGPTSTTDELARIGGNIAGYGAITPTGVGTAGLGVGARAAISAGQGLIGANIISGLERGEFAKPWENVLGALFPAALEGATPLISKLADRLEVKNLMTPAKLNAIKDKLIDAGENIDDIAALKDPSAVGEWMLKRGFQGSRKKLVQDLMDWSENSKATVDELLASHGQLYQSKYAGNALKLLKKEYSQPSSSAAEQKLARVEELIQKQANGGLWLEDINNIKRMVGEDLNPFTASGKVKISKKDQGALYNDLKTFIEKEADKAGLGNIKMLNNETSVAFALSKAIAQKEASEASKELLKMAFNFSLNNIGGLAGGVQGYRKEGDWTDAVVGFIAGELAQRVGLGLTIKSPAFTTKLASILKNLSGTERMALQNWTSGKQIIPEKLSIKLSDKIGDVVSDIMGGLESASISTMKSPASPLQAGNAVTNLFSGGLENNMNQLFTSPQGIGLQ